MQCNWKSSASASLILMIFNKTVLLLKRPKLFWVYVFNSNMTFAVWNSEPVIQWQKWLQTERPNLYTFVKSCLLEELECNVQCLVLFLYYTHYNYYLLNRQVVTNRVGRRSIFWIEVLQKCLNFKIKFSSIWIEDNLFCSKD